MLKSFDDLLDTLTVFFKLCEKIGKHIKANFRIVSKIGNTFVEVSLVSTDRLVDKVESEVSDDNILSELVRCIGVKTESRYRESEKITVSMLNKAVA